nr:EOG090X09DD [Artemia franciscana]
MCKVGLLTDGPNISVDIRLAPNYFPREEYGIVEELPNLVTPGEVLPFAKYLRGHGTYVNDKRELIASVAGVITTIDDHVSVVPLKSRYSGAVGDVIVGRITEVQQKRWKVDTNSRLDSVLNITNVNLLGGEHRRRSEADLLAMRNFLREGDLISAEIQAKQRDDTLVLHTRNLKYGKLSQGILVKVPPHLIKTSKLNFHNLPYGASIIIGSNGYIFVGPTMNEDESTGGYVQNLNPIPLPERQVIIRLRNCVELLSQSQIMIFDTTVTKCYEASIDLGYNIKDLILPEVIRDVASVVRSQLILRLLIRLKLLVLR